MNESTIRIKDLSKIYDINDKFSLGPDENNRSFYRKAPALHQEKKIYALNNITLDIAKGSIVGIMGHNGSGKSTLLKVISGITKPTSGQVTINGNIASMLELGTGFHPELTGLENIYFSAGLSGLTRKQIKAIEQDIVDFSELGEFIHIQIKYYSSGMSMRLAFSIIAHIEADIVLLDEVFAVGDIDFKQKCEKRIIEMAKSVKTIVLVSHDLGTISKICNQFVWMDEGKIRTEGSDIDIFNTYLLKGFTQFEDMAKDQGAENAPGLMFKKENLARNIFLQKKEDGAIKAVIRRVENQHIGEEIELACTSQPHSEDNVFYYDQPITISCRFQKKTTAMVMPVFALSYQASSLAIACHPALNNNVFESIDLKQTGVFSFSCILPPFFLNKGLFGINLYFIYEGRSELLSYENMLSFSIKFNEYLIQRTAHNFNGPIMKKLDWTISKIQ